MAWSAAAQAQLVDPNVQTQIDTFAVRPSETTLPQDTVIVTTPVYETIAEPIPLAVQERDKLRQLKRALERSGNTERLKSIDTSTPATLNALFTDFNIRTPQFRNVRKQVGVKKQAVPQARTTRVTVSAAGGYSYESNASKSNLFRQSDSIATASGSVLIRVPVDPAAKDATLALFAGTTTVRYDRLTVRDIDLPLASATYSFTTWKNDGTVPGLVTSSNVSVGVEATSYMRPTYASSSVNLLTPNVSWGYSNIPLSNETCGTGKDARFCHFAGVRVSLRHSLTDVATVDNTTLRAEGSLGWAPVTGLTLSATAGVQGSRYVHFIGGREDFLADVGGRLEWAFAPNASLAGSLKYTFFRSSISRLNWNGLAVSPQLKLSWTF